MGVVVQEVVVVILLAKCGVFLRGWVKRRKSIGCCITFVFTYLAVQDKSFFPRLSFFFLTGIACLMADIVSCLSVVIRNDR